uniref:phosphopantetheine-binding protein n=4 Tax=Burkholderiaceae TaxID=119060 RepID=UPI002FE14A38
HLRGHLPEYMVPAAFVWMEQLPLTPNGKLDRRALPAPDLSALQVREYEAPVGDTEQAIARIWAALLNVEQVGRHDNFFDLGGHSLLATQVTARIRETFEVEIPLNEIFRSQTLVKLAEAVVSIRLSHYDERDILALTTELDSISEEELRKLIADEYDNSADIE